MKVAITASEAMGAIQEHLTENVFLQGITVKGITYDTASESFICIVEKAGERSSQKGKKRGPYNKSGKSTKSVEGVGGNTGTPQ